MKKFFYIAIALVMVLGLVACTSAPTTNETPSTEVSTTASPAVTESVTAAPTPVEFPEMEINFSTSATETDYLGKGLSLFKQGVEQATGGKVKINMYRSSSYLPQDQEIPAIMAGNLDMNGTDPAHLADYVPSMAMLNSPYLFRSLDHWKAFYQGDLVATMFDDIAEETGVRILGALCQGTRTINLRVDRKVTSRADLSDIKLRMPNSEAWLFLGEALGGNPVPVAWADLYVALQTGTADGQDNPLAGTRSAKLYEVTKSTTMTNHIYLTTWISISDELWKSLSPELQQVIQDSVNAACNNVTESIFAAQDEDRAYMEGQGLKIYDLTDEEMANYQQEVVNYYFDHPDAIKDWDMDLYDAIQGLA